MPKIVVIGAGILGSSIAYYLAKDTAEVVLIDREEKGQSTDAAAGLICPWISQRRNKAWYKLAKGGARLYPKLIAELRELGEMETGYNQVGALSLQTDEEKLLKIRDRALKRREDSPEIGEVTVLDAKETKDRFPLLGDNVGAVHIGGAARVDGKGIRLALLEAAKKLGATYFCGDAELMVEKDKITGVKINNSVIEADVVIAANGAWMNELLQPIGIEFDVTPQKGQILHVQVPEMDTSTWPVILTPTSSLILPFDQRIVIGSTHEKNSGFDERTTTGALYEILQKAMEIAPGLHNSTILETRVGFRPVTPNFLPVFGSVPGNEELFLANGLGSSGLTTAPYIGRELAKLVLGNNLEIDIGDYDVAGALK